MIENIRGLSSVYTVLTPAAYEVQARAEVDKALPYLHTARDDSNGVVLALSPEALALIKGDSQGKGQEEQGTEGGKMGANVSNGLDDKERAEVQQLASADREVRAHEQAHMAAGGNLVRSGANFEYTVGPDGKRYAVGGEVTIDTSEEKDPDATLRKAGRIRQAAMAPAKPSAQDMRVAAEAAAMAVRAQQEIAKQKQDEDGYRTGMNKSTISVFA